MSRRYLDDDWWPAPLPDNVVLGARTWLYSSYAFLHYRSTRPVGVRIGDDTGVYDGTAFELGPDGEVEIGRFGTVVAPTIATNGPVRIGNHAFISNDVYIADDAVALPPAERGCDRPSPPIVMGDAVWVGTRTVILAGASLGDGAIVGAGTLVDFPVPPYAVVAGNPARVVGSAPPGTGPRAPRRTA
jgi:acetyltransferase-like isoleucine patch superfamily enzyme